MRALLFLLGLLLAAPAWADMYPDASNAKLPEARSNLLYTPPACDGFTAANGGITGGATLFASATASFTAADVGKRIAISGAGATQHAGVATLVGAGTGYVPNDRITLAGGTGTAAVLRVRAVSAGAITEIGIEGYGAYSAVPAGTIAQASTTGAGTGATVTMTWLRDALSTTIAGVVSGTQANLAAVAGATVSGALFGYGSDYAPAINAALSVNKAVQLPMGACGIASPIALEQYSRLSGATQGTSTLMWLGPAQGGPMINSGDPSGQNGLVGGVIEDITVEGLDGAGTCLYWHGLAAWRLSTILARNCVSVIADMDGSSVTDGQGFLENTILGLTLTAVGKNSRSAYAMKWGNGNNKNNVGYNRFVNFRIIYTDQTAFQCTWADNNHFFGVWIYHSPGAGLWAMDLEADNGPSKGSSCQGNSFYGYTSAHGADDMPIRVRGGLNHSAMNNLVYGHDVVFPQPVIDSGGTLVCRTRGYRNCGNIYPEFKQSASASPAATSSATAVHMGLGAAFTFTPMATGRATLTLSGNVAGTSLAATSFVGMRYGTGAAPANGDAVTGTGCDTSTLARIGTPVVNVPTPFYLTCKISGLTIGGTYWGDAVLFRIGGAGTVTLNDAQMLVQEKD